MGSVRGLQRQRGHRLCHPARRQQARPGTLVPPTPSVSPLPAPGRKVINVIDGGRVVESGSYRDLLREGGAVTELCNEQFEAAKMRW